MDIHEFDRLYCRKLNSQQLEAVHTVDGPVLLLAVPGSGKTTVLVTRLGYMVLCRNIRARNILTMTYTVSATVEMRQRFAGLFGAEHARGMEFCTINGLASRIISFYSRCHGKTQPPRLIENDEAVRLVGELWGQINGEYATDSQIKDIRSAITYIKNMMLNAQEREEHDFGIENMEKIYQGYCAALRNDGMMDFDDQLSYALTILRRYGDVLEHFQDRFPYICVDEAQDTSKIQHEIISLLAKKHGNIFMVGDEDQSIYGFRAAWPQALLDFEKNYTGAKVLLMEQNYRSGGRIVGAADGFIAKNEQRRPKTMLAARDVGLPPFIIEAESREMQYAYLFEIGRQCWEETAVLYRNNDSALPLVDLLERHGLPYNCRKFEDTFFSHRVVADIRDIIRFAHEPDNGEIYMRIYYKLGSPVSRRAAELACADSRRNGRAILHELARSPELSQQGRENAEETLDVLNALPVGSAEAALVHIWKSLKYSSYAAKNSLDAGKNDILCMLARREKSPLDFLRRLEELESLLCRHENSPDNHFVLSTIHSSKGLEYERVYLMDMFDGILPSKRGHELRDEQERQQHEEDRRLFYVGMTRAKDELYIFNCHDRGSEFVSEIILRLPKARVDMDDVFSPMQGNLLGKSYSHREKGKGRVAAQCDDRLLVYFPGHEPELMDLATMMAQRDPHVEYVSAKTESVVPEYKPEPEPEVNMGTKLLHKRFGEGVVLSVKKGVAAVHFEGEKDAKHIVLRTAFKNGIISIK